MDVEVEAEVEAVVETTRLRTGVADVFRQANISGEREPPLGVETKA